MTLFCLRILYRSVIVFVSLSALCDAPWWSVLSLRASHTLSHPHTKLWQQLGFTAPRPAGFTRQTDPSHRKPISQEQRGQVRACLECSPAPSGGWSPFSKRKRTCALLHSWLHSCLLNFSVPHPKLLTFFRNVHLICEETAATQRVLRRWEGSGLQLEEKDRHAIHALYGLTGGTTKCSQAVLLKFLIECICQTLLY